jgi:hypothetical protein
MTCSTYSGLSTMPWPLGATCTEDSSCDSLGDDYCCGYIDVNTNRTLKSSYVAPTVSYSSYDTTGMDMTVRGNCVMGRQSPS